MLVGLAALLFPAAAATAGALGAGELDRVVPFSPADGAAVGPRPVLHIRYEGRGELSERRLRFRITLRPRGSSEDRYVFDERRSRRGWLMGQPGERLYRPRKPLDDGEYRWRVWSWDGLRWVPGGRASVLRVDSVPPAEVSELRVRFERELGRTVLEWEPVSLDRNGRPEFVARYHVYRYERRSLLPIVRAHEIGVAEQPRFVDRELETGGAKILFYKVAAEDEAGNETGRRD